MVRVLVVLFLVKLCWGALSPQMQQNICPYADGPTYDACTMKSLNAIWPYFLKGDPSVGLTPLDPLNIPSMQLNDSYLFGVIKRITTFTNSKITGLQTLTFKYYKSDLANLESQLIVNIEWLNIESYFDFLFQILGIPYHLRGRFVGKFTNITVNTIGSIKRVNVDGVDYFQLNTLKVDATIQSGHISRLRMNNVIYQPAATILKILFNLTPGVFLNLGKSTINDDITVGQAQILRQGLAMATADEWLPGAPNA